VALLTLHFLAEPTRDEIKRMQVISSSSSSSSSNTRQAALQSQVTSEM
jgi:hypothetical protein